MGDKARVKVGRRDKRQPCLSMCSHALSERFVLPEDRARASAVFCIYDGVPDPEPGIRYVCDLPNARLLVFITHAPLSTEGVRVRPRRGHPLCSAPLT